MQNCFLSLLQVFVPAAVETTCDKLEQYGSRVRRTGLPDGSLQVKENYPFLSTQNPHRTLEPIAKHHTALIIEDDINVRLTLKGGVIIFSPPAFPVTMAEIITPASVVRCPVVSIRQARNKTIPWKDC